MKLKTNDNVKYITPTKEFKNTTQIIEIKPGWHNFILEEPLKRL